MAMSFALLGLRAPGIEIAGAGCVAKTFPRYWEEGRSTADRVPAR
jgi:3-phosphoshikimate 1-carboxyvinyltransferase